MPEYIRLAATLRLSPRFATRQRRKVLAGFLAAASLRYFPVW